jgi:predicted ATPase
LAFHHRRGADYAQAVRFYNLAAHHALGRSGYQEAIAQAREGLALLPYLAESADSRGCEFDLHMNLGPALMAIKGYGDHEVEESYARALELCHQLGETTRMFPVLWGLWRFYNSQGDFQTARRVGEQLLALSQDQGDSAQCLAANQALGFTLFYLGEFVSARMHLESGVALIDAEAQLTLANRYGSAPGVTCLALLAQVLWALGHADQARQRCREACGLADALAHPHSQVSAHFVTARVYLYCRDPLSVQSHTEALMAVATEQSFAQRVAAGEFLRGWLLAMQGQPETGLAQMRQGLAGLLDTGAVIYQPLCLLVLAEVHGQQDQTEAALRALSEALAIIGEHAQSYLAAELYRLQAELHLRHAPVEMSQAERGLQQALDIARRQQAKAWELRAAMSLARLWQRQGKRQAAYGLLEPMYSWFTEGFDTADLQEAKGLLAALTPSSSGEPEP